MVDPIFMSTLYHRIPHLNTSDCINGYQVFPINEHIDLLKDYTSKGLIDSLVEHFGIHTIKDLLEVMADGKFKGFGIGAKKRAAISNALNSLHTDTCSTLRAGKISKAELLKSDINIMFRQQHSIFDSVQPIIK